MSAGYGLGYQGAISKANIVHWFLFIKVRHFVYDYDSA